MSSLRFDICLFTLFCLKYGEIFLEWAGYTVVYILWIEVQEKRQIWFLVFLLIAEFWDSSYVWIPLKIDPGWAFFKWNQPVLRQIQSPYPLKVTNSIKLISNFLFVHFSSSVTYPNSKISTFYPKNEHRVRIQMETVFFILEMQFRVTGSKVWQRYSSVCCLSPTAIAVLRIKIQNSTKKKKLKRHATWRAIVLGATFVGRPDIDDLCRRTRVWVRFQPLIEACVLCLIFSLVVSFRMFLRRFFFYLCSLLLYAMSCRKI